MLFLRFIVLPHNYLLRNCYLQHCPLLFLCLGSQDDSQDPERQGNRQFERKKYVRPPIWDFFSMTRTLAPASLSWIAAWIPALPPPTMTRSKSTFAGLGSGAGHCSVINTLYRREERGKLLRDVYLRIGRRRGRPKEPRLARRAGRISCCNTGKEINE
jgi:hypothetical protein